mmetsp:Transcript_9402/g.30900  ORF Transcript_9402/g.30900 Transcript_9402/m.30900 type:complete len:238 (+) Transcript_9402:24-737(+)
MEALVSSLVPCPSAVARRGPARASSRKAVRGRFWGRGLGKVTCEAYQADDFVLSRQVGGMTVRTRTGGFSFDVCKLSSPLPPRCLGALAPEKCAQGRPRVLPASRLPHAPASPARARLGCRGGKVGVVRRPPAGGRLCWRGLAALSSGSPPPLRRTTQTRSSGTGRSTSTRRASPPTSCRRTPCCSRSSRAPQSRSGSGSSGPTTSSWARPSPPRGRAAGRTPSRSPRPPVSRPWRR